MRSRVVLAAATGARSRDWSARPEWQRRLARAGGERGCDANSAPSARDAVAWEGVQRVGEHDAGLLLGILDSVAVGCA